MPSKGVHFAFEKLYVNQSEEEAEVSISYASLTGSRISLFISLLGALLLGGGLVAVFRGQPHVSKNVAAGGILGGLVLLGVTIGYLGTRPGTALTGFAVAVVLLVVLDVVEDVEDDVVDDVVEEVDELVVPVVLDVVSAPTPYSSMPMSGVEASLVPPSTSVVTI